MRLIHQRRRTDPAVRFFDKVEKTDTCWLWTGAGTGTGYGTFWAEGGHVLAHRWSYENFIGPIPEGLEIDHLCRTRNCVNPEHLEPVTRQENARRGSTGQGQWTTYEATHCTYGHPYDEANSYITPEGRRRCRTCRREAVARYDRKASA